MSELHCPATLLVARHGDAEYVEIVAARSPRVVSTSSSLALLGLDQRSLRLTTSLHHR